MLIDFLPEADFVKAATTDQENPTDTDRDQARQQAAMLRALGLIQGDVDLLARQKDLSGSGTLAYYDPDTKHVEVRGTEINVAMRVTLVHELTHAWQDQQYDLTRLSQLKTSEERDAFRTMGEGDAVNSENAYIDQLSDPDHKLYDSQSKSTSDTATTGIKNVPDVLVADFSAPYAFGPPFLEGVKAGDGQTGVDRAFKAPPVDEHQVMLPWVYLGGKGAPESVPTPDTAGVKPVQQDTLGALFVYLMLAEHIDPHMALAASDRWMGDAYAVTDENGKVCVKATVAAADPTDTGIMKKAFDEWAAVETQATVTLAGNDVALSSCDPGVAGGPACDRPVLEGDGLPEHPSRRLGRRPRERPDRDQGGVLRDGARDGHHARRSRPAPDTGCSASRSCERRPKPRAPEVTARHVRSGTAGRRVVRARWREPFGEGLDDLVEQ